MGWIQIALFVVSLVVNYALQRRQFQSSSAKPAALSDFAFPQADEGTPQAVVFGDVWTGDWMVLATGNYRAKAIRK